MTDITFHYPPDLLTLLIKTIPKLCKSKADLLLFFQGAGVPQALRQPYDRLLATEKNAFTKYQVTRELLIKLNERGEGSLEARREILKRVTEFEDFSVCWESDRDAARGLVAQIRYLVNVKDSFTRMRIEREEEQRKRVAQTQMAAAEQQARKARRDKVKSDLYGLFGVQDPHKRGRDLEKVLNELFACHNIHVSEPFTVKGKCGEGVTEQIDGLVELDGHLYLVEMKWWNSPLGAADVAPHLVRVFNRGGQVRGIFISYTDFTAPAIDTCRSALSRGAVVVLATLNEVVTLMEREGDLQGWLKRKIRAALVDKEPYFRATD